MELTKIEKAVVLEDVFRKLLKLEEVDTPGEVVKIAIERRRAILAKSGIDSVKFEELRKLGYANKC